MMAENKNIYKLHDPLWLSKWETKVQFKKQQ